MEEQGFFPRLKPYTKPVINSIIGLIVSIIQGSIFPVFGVFMIKMLFSLFAVYDLEKLRRDSDIWCLAMFLCAITSFVTGFA